MSTMLQFAMCYWRYFAAILWSFGIINVRIVVIKTLLSN